MKTVLTPKYYNDFQCIGPACEDNCCSVGFDIPIRKKDYDFMIYKSKLKNDVKHVFQRTRKFKGHYAEIELKDGACPLLTEEKWCSAYAADGEDRLPEICRTYPRRSNNRGSIVEKYMVLSCPEVVRKVCFDEHAMEMTQVVERSNQKKTKYTRPIWFHDLRYFMHEILHIPNISFEEKFYTIGLTLSELTKYSDGQSESMGNAMAACRETISQGLIHGMFQQQQPSSYHQALLFSLYHQSFLEGVAGANKYVMRRMEIVKSRIARVMQDNYLDYQALSERAERYEAYLQDSQALARYDAYMKKRPYAWSNYVLHSMWKLDFPNGSWQGFLYYTACTFAFCRSALILLAHEGDLSDDDFVLVVQSFQLFFQTPTYVKFHTKMLLQFDDYMDFKLPDNGFSLTPLLLLKLPNHEDASTQMPLPEQTTPEQPTDSA